MKIALFGYGRMGKAIEQLAADSAHCITAVFTHSQRPIHALEQADIAIDFSHAAAVLSHAKLCASQHKPLVIGTTGWEDQLPVLQQIAAAHPQLGFFYSPNFSIGLYLFHKMVEHAALLMQAFDDYDVSGIESHHRHKADAPSGTAKLLTQTVQELMPRLTELSFTSVRCGHIPGKHTLLFDGPFDSVTLTHEARSREGFARGALMAAEWLLPRQGLLTMKDLFQDKMQGNERCK